MDIKCPSSGESDKMDWNNITKLTCKDQVKFVLANRQDFEWAIDIIQKYALTQKTTILCSPLHNVLEPAECADWILKSRIPIRLNLQLQKYIWDPHQRGV